MMALCEGEMFQHTAARRRLTTDANKAYDGAVSTHSRPKAAAMKFSKSTVSDVFQHTAARRRLLSFEVLRTKASMFQHTAARRRLYLKINLKSDVCKFQHTAARRRLAHNKSLFTLYLAVSTHSRPKAAGVHGKNTVRSG